MAGRGNKSLEEIRAFRATVDTDDVFAGRRFWQWSSEEQRPPEGDKRYRVAKSARFYVLQLMGTWIHVSESAERTIQYRNGLRWVRFEKREYQLRKEREFKPFLKRFVGGGCSAYVGGKYISSALEVDELEDAQFIYITSSGALKLFNEMKRGKQSG